MAKLIKCKACGEAVSKDAPSCPKCGNPIKRKPIGCGSAIVLVLLAVVVAVAINNMTGGTSAPSSYKRSTPAAKSTVKPAVIAPGSQWSYSQRKDDMSAGNVSHASVRSLNAVNFDFPYNGLQHGTIFLRTHPRHGKHLIFQIEKGQINCVSYEDCNVLIRFDDGQAATFKAVAPDDGSNETIFIRDYHGFVGKMLKAKRVRVSVSIYNQGNPVFTFDVSDFTQSKYLPK